MEGLERAAMAFRVGVGFVVELNLQKDLIEICYNQLRCWVSVWIP